MKNNILLVSNMYPSPYNPGFGVFVENIYKQLLDAGLHLDRVVIDRCYSGLHKKLFAYVRFYLTVFLKARHYQTFYAHFVSHTTLPFIVLHKLGVKFTLISHVHGGDVKLLAGYSGLQFRLKRQLVLAGLSLSKTIIVPSRTYATLLINEYGVPESKIIVYPSGGVNRAIFCVDDSACRQSGLIGYAGRLIKSKNVDVILRAMVLTPKLRLEIVGDGAELAHLSMLAQALNIADRVVFLPPMSQTQLAGWFNRIDVLVYPSASESLGLVPVEAICCGVKAVLSRIPAFDELHDNGLQFSFCDAAVPASVAAAITAEVRRDAAKQLSMYQQNMAVIDTMYSSTSTVEALKRVFT